MPLLSDAELRKLMHQSGYTTRGAIRKPKAQRRKYAGASARPSASQVQAIRKVSGEKKGVDTLLAIGPFLSTTSTNVDIVPVNLVQTGAGSYNRVGRKIFNKSVRVMGVFRYQYAPIATTENLEASVARMVIVWDKQPSGVLPIWSDIFATTLQASTEAGTLLGPPAFDNMSRFQVLRDIKIVASPQVYVSSGTEKRTELRFWVDEYVKLGNRQSVFSADTTPCTIADVSTGCLYVGFRAENIVATSAEWATSSEMVARLRYSD